jgi:hypothetical protein
LADTPFTLQEAHEICLAPYLDESRRREATRAAEIGVEALRSGGVSWSGLGAGRPRAPRSPAQIRADAEAALARAAAFADSPRGRFLIAVRALEQAGYAAEAECARAAFARGFADPDRPACPAAIGAALAAVARIGRPEARDACLALADLLNETLKLAAE